MGMTIVLGGAGTGKSHWCREAIRQRLRQSAEGQPLLLLLPEHATFQAEWELAKTPGLFGFARAHVLGFRRFAHRVLLETGGAVRPHITELGKKLVLSRLLREHRDELTVFRQAAGQRSFAETLAGMIKEFKAYAVEPEALLAAQQGLQPSPLTDKLRDLYLLYHDFEVFMQSKYTDPEDFLQLLADNLEQSSLTQGAEVWLDGFSWFNPREMAVLARLCRTAAAVTVTLCLPEPDAAAHQEETGIFHRQWNTLNKLRLLAAECGIPIREVVLPPGRRFMAQPELAHLEQHLFRFPAPAWQQAAPVLLLAEAANRRVEVEGMARDMIARCREDGYRWREMAVLLRDMESYSELVETVLTDYQIPFFSDRHRQAVHHPLAELIRSALETVTGRWNYEAVFRCLKTDFFPLPREAIDQLENYVLEFGIGGSLWTKPEPWRFVRRFSLGEEAELNDSQLDYLDAIHASRLAVSAPLLALSDRLKQAGQVRELAAAVYYFLEELQVPEQVENWAARDEQAGELDSAREHRQIWAAVVELLEQVVETCGDLTMTAEDFLALLQDGLDSLRLQLIPPGLDHVTIADLEQNTVDNVRAVYVLGVNDGVLPRRGRGEGLLSDQDRALMASSGVELAPGAAADNFAERYTVYTALTRSRQRLWVSYPLADEEGKGLTPSLLIKRLRQLFPRLPLTTLPAEPPEERASEYIAQPQRSVAALVAAIRRFKTGEVIQPVYWDVYNWALGRSELRSYLELAVAGLFHNNQALPLSRELAGQLYPHNKKLRGSVTRLESFRACPFRHFAQYGLTLKERAVFRLQPLDLGQFLHAALKAFGEQAVQSGRGWGEIGDDECRTICGQIVGELIPKLQNEILLSTGQYRHITRRLEGTVKRAVQRLVEFDRASGFKPVALEQSFGQGQADLPALVYSLSGGLELELVGQIDRLDCALHNNSYYILVIDYKSGGAWLTLPEVYYGLKLQLLTYLLAARGAGQLLFAGKDCRPAGVLYYFLKNPSLAGQTALSPEQIQKALNQQLKMPGWVVDDPEIIRLLDRQMDSRSDFLKLALKKDGTVYSNCLAYVRSEDEFTLLLQHMEQVLIRTGEAIMDGQVGIEPYQLQQQSPCGYCRYRPVCQFDESLPENQYRKLPAVTDEIIWRDLGGKGDPS